MRQLVELVVPDMASLAVLMLTDDDPAFDEVLVAGATRNAATLEVASLACHNLPDAVQAAMREALAGRRRVSLGRRRSRC